MPPTGPSRPATFREVFTVREFRPLFGTFLLSTAGDELARVALTVLVYQRTDSPLLAALTFAIGHLPWLLGGPLLSAFADRLPRHRVLISTDAVRAVVLAVMAIPGTPLPVLLGLLFLVSLCAPPFESARSALMADVLEGERYIVATSLTNITLQLAQVVGFLAAGALVAVLSPSAALLIDAVDLRRLRDLAGSIGLKRRPAPVAAAGEGPRSLWQDTGDGPAPHRPAPACWRSWACSGSATLFDYASEGVAAPLVDELGQRATAHRHAARRANPLGVTIGGLVLARLVPPGPAGAAGDAARRAVAARRCCRRSRGGHRRRRRALLRRCVVGLLFLSGLGASWLTPAQRLVRPGGAERVPRPRVRGRGQRPLRRAGPRRARGGARGRGRRAQWRRRAVGGARAGRSSLPPLLGYRRTQGHMAAATAAEGPSTA